MERIEPLASKRKDDCLLDVLDGVNGGRVASSGRSDVVASARSALFPARRTVKFGEDSARASMRKVGSAAKEA